jgi:hypothetical protein
MYTTSSSAVVPGDAANARSAVLALAREMWAVADDDIVEDRGDRIVHAVRLDGEVACWLTWELSKADGAGTAVRLVHDELDTRPAPAPDLDGVLAMLSARLSDATRA